MTVLSVRDDDSVAKRIARTHFLVVIAGLDPVIHAAARLARRSRSIRAQRQVGMDHRVKPGGDEGGLDSSRRRRCRRIVESDAPPTAQERGPPSPLSRGGKEDHRVKPGGDEGGGAG
jgi:hypothetical protein